MGIAARRRIGSKHVTDEFNHERFRYVVDCTTSDSCVKGGKKLIDQGLWDGRAAQLVQKTLDSQL